MSDSGVITIHLVAALLAGSIIGFERSLHGHPAGFRTHALVCPASSLLMLITLYQWKWLPPNVLLESVRMDPTRMAQGIMTGIGFLGAGVIFKEGMSVRGLTTGVDLDHGWHRHPDGGWFFPSRHSRYPDDPGGAFALSHVRRQDTSPVICPVSCRLRPNNVMPEEQVRSLVLDHGFEIVTMNYRATRPGLFEYRMDIRTTDPDRASKLVEALLRTESVREFRISRTGCDRA